MRRSASIVRAVLRCALPAVLLAGCGDSPSSPDALPTLTAISPTSAVQGTSATVTLTGTNFVVRGTTALAITDAGVTVDALDVTSSTSATAHVTIAPNAPLGTRRLSLTTASGGTSGDLTFTILPPPPTLASLSTATLVEGTTITETLTGTNFVPGATTVAVSGVGVVVSNVSVINGDSLTASFIVSASTDLGARQVTVTTPGGTSAAQAITINPPPPTLTAINPTAGITGTMVNVTLTGTSFVSGSTTVSVSGTGVTVGNVGAASATSTAISASFTIDANAALGPRNVTVTTVGGTSNVITFTVRAPAPTIASFTATPETFDLGESVTLAWKGITNATTCSIDHGVGTVPCTDGEASVMPSATTTYRLTAIGPGGNGTATATVVPNAPTLNAISPSTRAQGSTGVVTLTGTNFIVGATTVTVSGAGVTVTGVSVASAASLTATFTIAASAALGARNVTVTNDGGTSAPRTLTIVAGPSITSFAASASVLTVAQPTILSWATSNATSCSIDNGVGTVVCTGSMVVTPGSSRTYKLTATANGATVTATAAVSVGTASRFVYASSPVDNTLSMFTINASTGALSPIAGGKTPTGSQPIGVTTDPAGKYAYVANWGDGTISAYTIDPVTGSLIANGIVAADANVRRLRVDPTGRFLYAVNQMSNSVSMYRIGADGRLTSNATIATDIQPLDIAIDPLGRSVYVADFNNGVVNTYQVNADGTLAVWGLTIAEHAVSITIDPTGKFVYVADRTEGAISPFSVASNGTLTFPLGPMGIAATPVSVVADPTGRYLFVVTNGPDEVRSYQIDQTTGGLTLLAALAAGSHPTAIAIDAAGKFAYVTNQFDNSVSMYTIGSGGSLSFVGTVTPVLGPLGITTSR